MPVEPPRDPIIRSPAFGYKVGRKCTLQAGYRYLVVNYRPTGGFIYNTATSGLLLGVTINVK
jgi:hypothetical protein